VPREVFLILVLAAVALSAGLTSASALPPRYIRLSGGDVLRVAGTRFICAVQQQLRNLASPVVGIVCDLGTSAGPIRGSYWVTLSAPNDVVVTRAFGANRSSLVFTRQSKAFVLTDKSVEVLRLGQDWQAVWSHARPG
jgi:hypothetical protein